MYVDLTLFSLSLSLSLPSEIKSYSFDFLSVDNVKIDQFAQTFIDAVGPDKQLSKETFKICCKKLEPLGVRIADTPFEDRLFALLDKDNSGTIDVSEFLTGMAVIVKGTPEDKLWLTFKGMKETKKIIFFKTFFNS